MDNIMKKEKQLNIENYTKKNVLNEFEEIVATPNFDKKA